MAKNLPDMLTVKDVQTFLNISKSTAYRLFGQKEFPSFLIGKSKRITREDFMSWLEEQKKKGA